MLWFCWIFKEGQGNLLGVQATTFFLYFQDLRVLSPLIMFRGTIGGAQLFYEIYRTVAKPKVGVVVQCVNVQVRLPRRLVV